MAVVEATSLYTYREDMGKNCKEYARTETATYIIVHWTRTPGSRERMETMGSLEAPCRLGVEGIIRSARKNSEPRE